MRLVFVVDTDDEKPKCNALSSKGERAMKCELPPGHLCGEFVMEDHYGRDRAGRWRAWPQDAKKERE